MLLGLGSYACTWQIGVPGHPVEQPMDAFGLIDLAVDLGLHLVQIDDNLPLEQLPASRLAKLVEHAQQRLVAVEVGTRGCDPQRLCDFIPIALALGSPFVRVVLDRGGDQPTVDQAIARLRSVGDAYRSAGLLLAVENHDRLGVADLRRLMQESGDHLRICLDTVNSLGCAEGPHEVVEGLRPWVVNLHIKDFRIRRADHQMGFSVEGTPAGEGQLDLPWTIQRLEETCATATLELWTPPDPRGVTATIATERDWIRRSLHHLHRTMRLDPPA